MDSFEMDYWTNFQLICKPEQSGKTFLMIQHIIKEMNCPIEGKEMINIIFCDNNLLLAKQSSNRIDSELTKYIHDGVAYAELSSHSRAACHNMKSVFFAIVSEGIRNIICCTNIKRMDDIYALIESLYEDSEFTRNQFHANIWLDEADKFMGFIDDTLIPVVSNYENVQVKLITATPEPLFKKYKYINVLPLENTTSEQYHGWEDNLIDIHPKKGCIEFAEFILMIAKENVRPGTKWFIPAMTAKASHEMMKDACLAANMAVLCVNGDGIVLTIPEISTPIYVEKDSEINETITKLYRLHNLNRFAFAITGNICIGRGISIMSESFMMDYAILSHYSSKTEASQIAGRMKGNIKHFSGYKQKGITIYTTPEFNKVAIEMEEKSRNLAKIAHEKEKEGHGTVLDKNEYKTCDKSFDYICHPVLFNTFAEAKNFLKTKEREMECRGELKKTKESPMHKCEEYWVSSKLLSAGQSVKDLKKEHRLTLEKANDIPNGRCISSTDKGSRYLILPVYETEATPADHEKYQVRYIKFKKDKSIPNLSTV